MIITLQLACHRALPASASASASAPSLSLAQTVTFSDSSAGAFMLMKTVGGHPFPFVRARSLRVCVFSAAIHSTVVVFFSLLP